MKSILFIDCETSSVLKLKKTSVFNYAGHWTTRLLGYCYAFDDSPVQTITDGSVPDAISKHVHSGGLVVAHNAAFERAMLALHLHLQISASQCIDTMHLASACGFPRKLEEVAKVFGTDRFQKDMAGHKVMLAFARPGKSVPCCEDPACRKCQGHGVRYIWRTQKSHPGQWEQLWAYCAQDVEVTRALYKALPPLRPEEHEMAAIDSCINFRGVGVDRPAAVKCQEIIDLETERINGTCAALTGFKLTQTTKVTEWCQARDPRVTSLAKDSVGKLLALEDLDLEVRTYLELREGGAKSSAKKVRTLLELMSDDDRLRWSYAFLGAISTGRWAGRGFQPQNLPRGSTLKLKSRHVEDILTALVQHGATPQILEWLRVAYGPPLVVISECIRGLLVPKDGKIFVGADLNAIEARMLAWLAQERWVVDSFERNEDLYVNQYAQAFGIERKNVDEYRRLLGKVMTLAFGYQGAVGAWHSMAKNYKVPPMTDEEIKGLVDAYRAANPAIVQFWWNCERAAKAAITVPGQVVPAGPLRNIRYCFHGGCLWCELPSKRKICYPNARLVEDDSDPRRVREILEYEGPHKVTRKWGTRQAYGGLLVENIVQAASSDILREAIRALEGREGKTRVVMHTHDEVTVECFPRHLSVKELEDLMSRVPSWAPGLPLRAKGWTGTRYQK